MSFLTACSAAQSERPLFEDIQRRPPDAQPATIEALRADRTFGEWVIETDRLCDRHGCRE